MNFKYYDLLSKLAIGMVAFYAIWKFYFPGIALSDWVVMPGGYVVGYFLDALSSLIEPVLFKTICGRPSEVLLKSIEGKDWTGIKKVKFYFADRAVALLRKDIGDNGASTGKMFGYAMSLVDSKSDSRVPDFNGHYALSRVILTMLIIAASLIEIHFYDVWYSWPACFAILFLAWNRYRERGYYYAREVLNEYLKMKE